MEQLVTFLTSNFQFVIVLVGILYFLFFRKSPLEKRPPNRMPDFGGEAHRRPERPGRPQTQAARTRPDSAPKPERGDYSQAEPAAFRPLAADETEEYENPIVQDLTTKRSGAPDANREPRAGLQQRDLAKAVVWSEILGRPRARKPYRR